MVVLGVLHLATHGQPVHVYIRNRHKDRYLHHLSLEILISLDNLGYHNPTVTGREDEALIVNLHTAWLTEERRNEEPKDEQKSRHNFIYR